ncbi:MAG: UDP-N-acetylglucosamine 2-epimerase [Paracoccaceae bacterium]|nr:UDP-N-acetylglucosamine 2-epimerase [Paracoccaceae bacterium]MDE2912828.1 UDP-N-acetylglucosamine 2-epimerase [Paracoccaceae bacterium]
MTRRLVFVTGTRADFGKIRPLAEAARDRGFRIGFFVTGMHMLERYGLTKIEVNRVDNVDVFEFLNQQLTDGQEMILAKTIMGFSDFLAEHNPDLVVVHGDRVEALACALTAATRYIRCAHVEGGEVSGTIDELFRHCNSKLATCHFVSSETARDRVMRMGEPADSVFVIGSPELDIHGKPSGVTIDQVRRHYDISPGEYGIVIFHPVTSETDTIGAQATALFGSLQASERSFVTILPNNDPGSDAIMAVIRTLPASTFRAIPSMRFPYFSELLKHAAVLVGNSSAGVREAPFLGVPSLDIGTRQTNRSEAVSVTATAAADDLAIQAFLDREWGRRYPSCGAFGTGGAAERFVSILDDPGFWSKPLQKVFTDPR